MQSSDIKVLVACEESQAEKLKHGKTRHMAGRQEARHSQELPPQWQSGGEIIY